MSKRSFTRCLSNNVLKLVCLISATVCLCHVGCHPNLTIPIADGLSEKICTSELSVLLISLATHDHTLENCEIEHFTKNDKCCFSALLYNFALQNNPLPKYYTLGMYNVLSSTKLFWHLFSYIAQSSSFR